MCPVGTFSRLPQPAFLSEPELQSFDLAIDHLSSSGARSEEEAMSTIALSNNAAKLMRLCEIEGFRTIYGTSGTSALTVGGTAD
jgi:hypothetical protein